ncbi:Arc family DNA-binding protein [Rhizobium sp. BE258]|uniref:Arc family DNA-binding protein n=1 Tax=Rhizobium sp. BE258 TaxID=2817722 RepID=UPI00285E2F61|nr:Arc family DNA-binding protein [Rhizobium sp. BE258]MDR7146178.1 hypothetical protein [Rhizobium sp. BE258]
MARGDFPSTKQAQFNLRLPDGMRDRIGHEASRSGRSMNAEIVARLSFTLNSDLGDREELNEKINRYQLHMREYIQQIAQAITLKNSYKFALEHAESSNRQNSIFLESLCHLIAADPDVPSHLREFATRSLESFSFHEEAETTEPEKLSSEIGDTEDELQKIIKDVKENAAERAANDPWTQAFGNNGIYTTVDISQRDERRIPDAAHEEKAEEE